MSLPIGLHGILLRTLFAFVLLLSVLAGKMLFDASQVPKRTSWIVMKAGGFGTNVDFLLHFRAASLPEFPRQIMASPMQLQVLVSLKTFMADFADESIRRQKRSRRKGHDFGIRICRRTDKSAQKRVMSVWCSSQSHQR